MTQQQPRPEQRTGERLSAVERDVTHLGNEVRSLGRKMDEGLATLASSLDHRLSGIVSEIRSNRTPVAALSGWAAVILTLVGAVIWPQMRTDDRIEAGIEALSGEIRDHVSNGHGDDDHVLRREMRLLDEQIAATLEAVTDRSMERMTLLDGRQDEMLEALRRRIAVLEESTRNLSGHDERIRSLERAEFGDDGR